MVALVKDIAMKAEKSNIEIPKLEDNIFGKPINESLPANIANLPADQYLTRELLTSRSYKSIGHKTTEQEKLDLESGILSDYLEPQVAWAVQMLNIKGYGTNNSGFSPDYGIEDPTEIPDNILWHSIDSLTRILTPQEIKMVESVPGAIYDVFKNGIFVNAKGKTLAQVKAIFDEVAQKLPDHSQPIKERFIKFEQALIAKNQHFVMKRELRNDQEYYRNRAVYLFNFVKYLRKYGLTETVGVASLGQAIAEEQYKKRNVGAQFIRKQFHQPPRQFFGKHSRVTKVLHADLWRKRPFALHPLLEFISGYINILRPAGLFMGLLGKHFYKFPAVLYIRH